MNCKTEIILPNNLPVAHTVAKPNRNEKIISDFCFLHNLVVMDLNVHIISDIVGQGLAPADVL